MKQLLKTSLEQLQCVLKDHVVSDTDEDELFACPAGYLRTMCTRCQYPILLRRDPADKENEYYMLVED
jgi:hypothetical protein